MAERPRDRGRNTEEPALFESPVKVLRHEGVRLGGASLRDAAAAPAGLHPQGEAQAQWPRRRLELGLAHAGGGLLGEHGLDAARGDPEYTLLREDGGCEFRALSWLRCQGDLAELCPGVYGSKAAWASLGELQKEKLWAGEQLDGPNGESVDALKDMHRSSSLGRLGADGFNADPVFTFLREDRTTEFRTLSWIRTQSEATELCLGVYGSKAAWASLAEEQKERLWEGEALLPERCKRVRLGPYGLPPRLALDSAFSTLS